MTRSWGIELRVSCRFVRFDNPHGDDNFAHSIYYLFLFHSLMEIGSQSDGTLPWLSISIFWLFGPWIVHPWVAFSLQTNCLQSYLCNYVFLLQDLGHQQIQSKMTNCFLMKRCHDIVLMYAWTSCSGIIALLDATVAGARFNNVGILGIWIISGDFWRIVEGSVSVGVLFLPACECERCWFWKCPSLECCS